MNRDFTRRLLAAGPMLGLLLVGVAFALAEPAFASERNFVTIAVQTVITAVAALGMTFVIASGGIDLSVGSAIALAGTTVAALLDLGAGAGFATFGGLAAGALVGLTNGVLVTRLSLAPFVVTLGTMGVARGVAKWISGPTSTIEVPRDAVAPLADLLVKQWLAPGLMLALALAMLAAFALKRTVFGVHALAVGSSEPTARLCGVPVERTKLMVYGLAGLMAGLAGALQMGRVGVGDPNASLGAELNVIAAVVLGGASLAGGSGSITGTLVGALLMSTLANGCNLIGWPPYVQQILTGVIIIAAVALDRCRQARA
ncbi:MAG: ABC transporter permease [Planctomycetota bacterium]|nr:ABC transporter permease [Planctomycetota bacterium]